MKSHPHLLVRDTLAEWFVRAARGDEEAARVVDALSLWAREREPSPLLDAVACETGEALFAAAALAERFEPLDAYVRDRAHRFEAACSWIRDGHFEHDVVECARAAWDAGLFFEVHELVEPVWLETEGARKPLLQGLIMAGAAMHHLIGGNTAGAAGLLRDAARHLEAPSVEADYGFAAFGQELATLGESVRSGAVENAEAIEDLPRLERTTDA